MKKVLAVVIVIALMLALNVTAFADSGKLTLEQAKQAALDYAAADGETLRPRYSPGYGDLPLAFQQDLFRALDCERRLGLTLTDSLLMVPSKSVTAIIGMKEKTP